MAGAGRSLLFVAGLLVAVAATAHASVLDTGDIESFESVGLPMDIPQEQIQELYKHIDDFLEEIREGPDDSTLDLLFNMELEPELEALISLQHYFENPETSVLAENMLQVCEMDMDNCPLLNHLPSRKQHQTEDGEGRKLLQNGKVYEEGNPDYKWLNLPPAPKNFGLVSRFQFYRDLYCIPPTVAAAEFDFIGRTRFAGVVYAFAVLGGSAEWDPATQQLTVQKPQVVYSKRPASVRKGGQTTKGSASEKACDFAAPIQIKGKGIGYEQVLGIEYQHFKPPLNVPIYIDALKPETWPSLSGWFQCWIDPGHPNCTPPAFALSPLTLNLPLQLLSLFPGLGFFGK